MRSLTHPALCTERLSIRTICPARRRGARTFRTYRPKDSVSEEPWMLTLDAHGWSHTLLKGDGRDERDVLAPVPRRLPQSPPSLGRPSVARHHGDVGRGLVHEHQALGVYPSEALPESTSFLLVSLGGTQRLFLSVQPSFSRIARLMVANDTLTAVFCSHSWQWRSRVASSFSSSCSHRARLCSEVARMRRLRPVEGLGSRSSPWRRRLT